VPSAHWFQCLPTAEQEMNNAEKNECMAKPKKRWTRKIAHLDCFYSKLYTLASEVYDCLQANKQYFPNLAKDKLHKQQ
jgi:hypothetical protein